MADSIYDGATPGSLARALSLPQVIVRDVVTSTMDVANELAVQGAPAGTLVLADAQEAGRGRGGRRWESRSGDGIWLTLVERLNDPAALDVLSLRIGLRAARALDRFVVTPIQLKWPNDLYVATGKVGGILVESRWRGDRPEWTAIGVGINVRHVEYPGGGALGDGTSRLEVLGELVPALRAAASARGHLTDSELQEFGKRDLAAGRMALSPQVGRVTGIRSDGALLLESPGGGTTVIREGSLVLEEPE